MRRLLVQHASKLIFGGVAILWGIPYLLIKIVVNEGVPPLFLAWFRIALAAVTLLCLSKRDHVLRALRERAIWIVAFSIAELAAPFPLIAIGEQHITSAVAAVLIATAPLFAATIAMRYDASERVKVGQLAGLFLGFAGVVGVIGSSGIHIAGRTEELKGAAAILCASACYAIGPIIFKRRLAHLDEQASIGASLAISALLLLPAAATHMPAVMPSNRAIGALLILGLLCTAVGMRLWGALIARVGSTRALIVTYLNPVVALVLGVGIMGERPGYVAVIGLVLILAGSWFSASSSVLATEDTAHPVDEPEPFSSLQLAGSKVLPEGRRMSFE